MTWKEEVRKEQSFENMAKKIKEVLLKEKDYLFNAMPRRERRRNDTYQLIDLLAKDSIKRIKEIYAMHDE